MEGLFCHGCDKILAANFAYDRNNPDNNWYCFNCSSNIGHIADTIAVLAGKRKLKYIPTLKEIEDLFVPNLISKFLIQSSTVVRWCYEQCEESTEKKID